MAKTVPYPDSVLMVGSIPFQKVDDVFTITCAALPGRLHSIPDGEVGERQNWIGWQGARLPSEVIRPEYGIPVPPGEKKTGSYSLNSVLPTQYDDVALASYASFVKLRERGTIPADVRFQVSLPTPFAVTVGFCQAEHYADIEPLYERRLTDSIKRIVKDIPHRDLLIQWDLSLELYMLEQERKTLTLANTGFPFLLEPYFTPVMPGVIDRLVRVCGHLPATVPVGFHLCYGDWNHAHWIQPDDTGLLVSLADKIMEAVGQTYSIEYIHLPVPRNRTDVAYFEPLKDLHLPKDTKLYLGLVHANDEQGTRNRIEVARRVCPYSFGVATECGLGRTPAGDIDSIFEISRAVTEPREVEK